MIANGSVFGGTGVLLQGDGETIDLATNGPVVGNGTATLGTGIGVFNAFGGSGAGIGVSAINAIDIITTSTVTGVNNRGIDAEVRRRYQQQRQ